MAVYTVHQPPRRKDGTAPDPDRFVLVRDGFYFWAFLFGPLWMIWRRLWLVLVLFVAAMIGLGLALQASGAPVSVRALAIVAVALLVGLEAATLRRWTFARRGWINIGVVVGDDLESAERRFFAYWIESGGAVPQGAAGKSQTASPRMAKDSAPDVVGLFPQPGQPR
jgi:hypothetical protein